jgi:hypothetical protein
MTDSDNLELTEKELLLQRAKQMGIKVHPNTGLEKLRLRIQNYLNDTTEKTVETDDEVKQVSVTEEVKEKPKKQIKVNFVPPEQAESPERRKLRLKRESSKQVRIRVTCMNPLKKEWSGEIFTISNSVVGTYKKYVPFNGDVTHVPNIIYKALLERTCQVFNTVKGPRGEKIRKGKLIKEFAVEKLDLLTPAELKELARKQAMANNLD